MIDTADSISQLKARQIVAAGHKYIGQYTRTDRTPLSQVKILHGLDCKIVSISERGYPTTPAFFHGDDGIKAAKKDAQEFLAWAELVQQPGNTTVSPCFDYDSTWSQVEGYCKTFHDLVKPHGYFLLPYGNGVTLMDAIEEGYAVGGWLCGSTGFNGYSDFHPRATIIQSQCDVHVCGLDADLDIVVNPKLTIDGRLISVGW